MQYFEKGTLRQICFKKYCIAGYFCGVNFLRDATSWTYLWNIKFTAAINWENIPLDKTSFLWSSKLRWIIALIEGAKIEPPQTNSSLYVTHSHKTRRKSPEHFLRYRPINMSQINRKQRNFQKRYLLFMGETLNKYNKWYIMLKLRISAFSASTNRRNYFPTLTAGFDVVGHILRSM